MKHSFHTFSHPHNKAFSSAFTLIELLVVVAIIAILAVVVVLTLNPAQLLAQSRDATRVSDMSTLNSAIALYQTDFGGTSTLGTSSIISVSLPDPAATSTAGTNCASLSLPTLPSSYSYDCSASSTYKNANALGWIPLNFQNISAGSPFSSVPTDPTNTSSSRLYYTYTTNGSNYEITANMESAKYKLGGSNDVISSDGGPLASLYEKGTKLGLEPLDYGDTSLVGYWPLNEGSGGIAYDMSGNNATGTWYGTQTGINSTYYTQGKVGSYAGMFDGSTNYVKVATPPVITGLTQLTVVAWIYQTGNTENYGGIVGYGGYTSNTGFNLLTDTIKSSPSGLYFQVGNTGLACGGCVTWNAWHLVIGVQGTTGQRLYVDGTLVVSNTNTATVNDPSAYLFLIGYRSNGDTSRGHFAGKSQAVRVYNRALSVAEIQAIYNAGK